MIFTVGRHCQVLLEKDREDRKPRSPRRYTLACTCRMKRRENGHCPHTLAIFEQDIRPAARKRVTVVEMKSASGVST